MRKVGAVDGTTRKMAVSVHGTKNEHVLSLNRSFIHSFIHSFILSFIYSFIHSFIHSLITRGINFNQSSVLV